LVIEYAIGSATVSISWSAYVASLLHGCHIDLPARWIAGPFEAVTLPDGSMAQGGYANIPAVIVVLLVTLLLMAGIQESARVNTAIVVIKLAVVVVFIGVGWSYINAANYTPFVPANTGEFGSFGISGLMMGAGTIFFAYIGFDAISTAAQECRNPQRDMPVGIIGSLAICTVLYILFALVLTGMVPYTQLGVAAPVALAIDKTPYLWMNNLVKVGIICGFTSVILVMLLGQSRVFYSMSRDGLVPRVFSEIHPRLKTPWRSNILFFFFVAPFSAFLPLNLVGRMTSIGTLFAFVIVCAGVWVMRVNNPGQARPFRTPWVPLVPILGMLVNFALMYSLGWSNWVRLIVWLVIGQVIYFGYGRRHSRLRELPAPAIDQQN
jgi:APA family basic amino acid/polyamine antiporter